MNGGKKSCYEHGALHVGYPHLFWSTPVGTRRPQNPNLTLTRRVTTSDESQEEIMAESLSS